MFAQKPGFAWIGMALQQVHVEAHAASEGGLEAASLRRLGVVPQPSQTFVSSSESTTPAGSDGPSAVGTWCFASRNDVLPVNRTMKKYKICVTSNLNFLLADF